MKQSLEKWMQANPDKSLGRGRKSRFQDHEDEILTLLQAGYTSQKIAQYLNEVEKVNFKKKDGKYVTAALSNYLRELSKKHGIARRRGRTPNQ
ncbi:MAG: hypothetical protein RI556_12170 [Hydrogenovibrio sp.]|uniref:hypothetical protein n=1 Tax=Hydrogenovibrio sp. TaxID=2065821 RepID=UPI0028706232|nr:hypothetical protein [Hydrogenovibrio sp.]MDR9499924.1 hypothetical protein [Hydrogenovibrio sp.]